MDPKRPDYDVIRPGTQGRIACRSIKLLWVRVGGLLVALVRHREFNPVFFVDLPAGGDVEIGQRKLAG